MKMADVEDSYVSHFGWRDFKSFREDWMGKATFTLGVKRQR